MQIATRRPHSGEKKVIPRTKVSGSRCYHVLKPNERRLLPSAKLPSPSKRARATAANEPTPLIVAPWNHSYEGQQLRATGDALKRRSEKKVIDHVFWRNFAVIHHGIFFMKPELKSVTIQFYNLATGRIVRVASLGRPAHIGLSVSPDERWISHAQIDAQGSNLMLADSAE